MRSCLCVMAAKTMLNLTGRQLLSAFLDGDHLPKTRYLHHCWGVLCGSEQVGWTFDLNPFLSS